MVAFACWQGPHLPRPGARPLGSIGSKPAFNRPTPGRRLRLLSAAKLLAAGGLERRRGEAQILQGF